MPLRSGLMFGGVVPQVVVLGGVRGCRNITACGTLPTFITVRVRSDLILTQWQLHLFQRWTTPAAHDGWVDGIVAGLYMVEGSVCALWTQVMMSANLKDIITVFRAMNTVGLFWGKFWTVSCLIKITVEYYWKVTFHSSQSSAAKFFLDEMGKFITFRCRVSSGCRVRKTIKVGWCFTELLKNKIKSTCWARYVTPRPDRPPTVEPTTLATDSLRQTDRRAKDSVISHIRINAKNIILYWTTRLSPRRRLRLHLRPSDNRITKKLPIKSSWDLTEWLDIKQVPIDYISSDLDPKSRSLVEVKGQNCFFLRITAYKIVVESRDRY